MQNLGQFLRTYAQTYHERTAYEIKRGFRTEKFSFAEVHTLALKTATFLKNCSLQAGDTIAVWSPNMPEYPILYFGCWLLGIVVVPIDIRTTEDTLHLFVTKAECQLGFKSKSLPGTFPPTVAQTYELEDLPALVQTLPPLENLPDILPDDPAEIAFTSGTTGTPKGVVLTHRNFLSNVSAFCQAFPLKKTYKTLSLLPLSHAFEQVIDFLAVFQTGITVVYLERINQVSILRALRKQAITAVAIVPQLLQFLLAGVERQIEKSGKQRAWLRLHALAPFLPLAVRRCLFRQVRQRLGKSLRFFGCGSAQLNRKLARKWEHMGIAIYEGYGTTETTALLTINTPVAKRPGSVGKTLPGIRLRVDSDSREIQAKGPNVFSGYFQDPEKTRVAFSHGWYKTGDIGTLDEQGYLSITGREVWRIVLPGGEKVYPEDIERKLDAHPLVRASCVVGVKREEGERAHAVVITRHAKEVDEITEVIKIIRQVNGQLSSHEQILEWSVWPHDDFPRTPILKIDRKKVAAAVAGLEEKRAPVEVSGQDTLIALLTRITKIPPSQIQETDALTDLPLDSLQRVELLSLIEEELGVAIAETEMSPQTTIAQLRELVQKAEVMPEEIPLNSFNYTPFIAAIRNFLQNIFVFPLHALFVPLQVKGEEHLIHAKRPVIFYFNHVGIMDAVCVLRVLPPSFRQKLVIAVNRNLWKEWRKCFVEFWAGGFPFDPQRDIKASLELTGEFLDRGFSIIIAPEGSISQDGRLQPFKSGIGLMAVHMKVPVIPVKIDPAYREIFPAMEGALQENFPKTRKCISVHIGKPMLFSNQISIEQATQEMQRAMAML